SLPGSSSSLCRSSSWPWGSSWFWSARTRGRQRALGGEGGHPGHVPLSAFRSGGAGGRPPAGERESPGDLPGPPHPQVHHLLQLDLEAGPGPPTSSGHPGLPSALLLHDTSGHRHWGGSDGVFRPLAPLTRSVLEGIATGTFLYITFLEILPHELSSGDQRIGKVVVMLCGFSVITAILFIKI
ncbi:unnamed protein product, partial [Staurois parvus]